MTPSITKTAIKDTLMRLLNSNVVTGTNQGRMPQSIFLEMYIFGKYTITDFSYSGNPRIPTRSPNIESFVNDLLGLDIVEPKSEMHTIFMARRDGVDTRSMAPFFIKNLTHEFEPNWLQHVEEKTRALVVDSKNGDWNAIDILVRPFETSEMNNLVGPVHAVTTGTTKKFVEAVDLGPNSVLMECGCGAPFFALQTSCIAKLVIAFDLESVIQPALKILNEMDSDLKWLARSIHLLPVDILEMTKHSFKEIRLDEVTHLSAFIGVDAGMSLSIRVLNLVVNAALVKFSLLNLPKLRYMIFRRKAGSELDMILDAYGFVKKEDSFDLILRGSSKFFNLIS